MGTAGHLEKDRHVRELKASLRREEEDRERINDWDRRFKEVLMWEECSRRRAAEDRERSHRYEIIFDWQMWDEDRRRGAPPPPI